MRKRREKNHSKRKTDEKELKKIKKRDQDEALNFVRKPEGKTAERKVETEKRKRR